MDDPALCKHIGSRFPLTGNYRQLAPTSFKNECVFKWTSAQLKHIGAGNLSLSAFTRMKNLLLSVSGALVCMLIMETDNELLIAYL